MAYSFTLWNAYIVCGLCASEIPERTVPLKYASAVETIPWFPPRTKSLTNPSSTILISLRHFSDVDQKD